MTLLADGELAAANGRAPADGETLTYVSRPRSITAASKRIEPGSKSDLSAIPQRPERWQDEAWAYYDNVPEIKFAGRFNGNALSRLRMYPAIMVDPDMPPMPIQDAAEGNLCSAKLASDALDESARMGDTDTVAGHLNDFGTNLTIPGDSYMIITPASSTEDETWQVYSESAVTKTDKGLAMRDKPNGQPTEFPEGTLAIRIWRRHSRWPGLADSNMRAILAEIEELLIYSRQFRAVGKSRNNAGLLFLHQDLDLPAPAPGPNGEPALTTFESAFTASMVTPTHDDASASSVVPHIVRGRGEPDKMIKHFPLDRKIDEAAIARVTFLIQRCAHGLDTPVEVLTGVADVNHWNAWQIEDQSYKMHLQPLAMVPAQGLARSFLRPALLIRGNRPEEVGQVVYALDSSALTVRPNRSIDAKDAFDRLAISWEAYRQHAGFADSEAPSPEEMEQRAVMGLGQFHRSGLAAPGQDVPGLPSGGGDATGGGTDANAARLAHVLGLLPLERERIAITASSRPVPRRRATDTGMRLAMIDARLRDRLQAAASTTMTSVLKAAGNRLRAQVQGNKVLRVMVKGVDPTLVATTLGPDNVDVGILDGSFDEVGWDFDKWTRQAQAATIRVLRSAAADEAAADAAEERYQRNQDANRDAAKAAFVASLMLLGSRRLFAPEATLPPMGEWTDRLNVPAGVVREALSLAGGSSGNALPPNDVPGSLDLGRAGGVALGSDALESLAMIDVQVDGWEWVHGDTDRPFDPHEALDGTTFADFGDPVLANDQGWPEDDFYWPGDHDGCTCWAIALTSESAGDAAPAE